MHGRCYYVFYWSASRGGQVSSLPGRVVDKPKLNMCLGPIWEYQRLYLETYNNPNLLKTIDYVWSGAMIKSRRCDLDPLHERLIENHQDFVESRNMYAARELTPRNIIKICVEEIEVQLRDITNNNYYSELRKHWCPAPKGFSNAINWKAFDHWYFTTHTEWPKVEEKYGSKREQLGIRRDNWLI